MPNAARPPAVLVSVQLPGVVDEEHAADLAELERLVHTLGYQVIARVTQRRTSLAPGAVLGEGKLAELAGLTGGTGVIPSGAPDRQNKARARQQVREVDEDDDEVDDDRFGDEEGPARPIVVVDHDISPSQARNLERATGAAVLDRTGVIVEIFHRHAQSREARLQVELARLAYVAPRMREGSGGADRQRGGIGGKGAGESALELDRRRIRDRMAELRRELSAIERDQQRRRSHRSGQRRVALVGYTNAGKSSLMRALTESAVLVEDKLFATLGTTVRALQPEVRPRILVSDTVGFIKKLPHDLVASFRSTLDEALEASLLLFVADASDPTFRGQLQVTREVLGEIGATELPSLLLLNKVDRLGEAQREELRVEYPDAILLSAKDPADVARLHQIIVRHFEASMVEGSVIVPYSKQSLVGEIHDSAKVLGEEYDERGALMRILVEPAALAKIQRRLAE